VNEWDVPDFSILREKGGFGKGGQKLALTKTIGDAYAEDAAGLLQHIFCDPLLHFNLRSGGNGFRLSDITVSAGKFDQAINRRMGRFTKDQLGTNSGFCETRCLAMANCISSAELLSPRFSIILYLWNAMVLVLTSSM